MTANISYQFGVFRCEHDQESCRLEDAVGYSRSSFQILEDDTCSFKDSYLCGDESLQSLLHKFSQLNHDNFCLSYLFTFRDFPGGSIGLAWTATPSSGGICAKHGLHQREEDGVLVNMSLNTGIVSLSR